MFRWLAARLKFLGSCVVLCTVVLVIVGRNSGVTAPTAGVVGLSVTYALGVSLLSCTYFIDAYTGDLPSASLRQITTVLNWMVRTVCDTEANFIAVERLKEYVELPGEVNDIALFLDIMADSL